MFKEVSFTVTLGSSKTPPPMKERSLLTSSVAVTPVASADVFTPSPQSGCTRGRSRWRRKSSAVESSFRAGDGAEEGQNEAMMISERGLTVVC